MKKLRNFFQFSCIVALAAFMAVSCNNEQVQDEPVQVTDGTGEVKVRAAKKKAKVAAKAYHYKTLAAFEKGKMSEMDLNNLAELQGKAVNFVVLYESIAPWAEVFNGGKNLDKTGDDTLNGLIESYEMTIVKQFEIDDENEGFVLEPNTILDNPVEAARELSMVEHILMVQVKEVPTDETQEETAANN